MELANAIKKAASISELDQHIQYFEEDMFSRAQKTSQLTVDMMHGMFFTPGSPRNGIEIYLLGRIGLVAHEALHAPGVRLLLRV